MATTAADVIARLGMVPHPEGGHFVEVWRGPESSPGGRRTASLIYFLLREGERSRWHAVDASEVWLWHAGDPLELAVAPAAGGEPTLHRLGGDNLAYQAVVPPGDWQRARSLGAWSLVSCVVAPAFHYEGFTIAAPGWKPGVQ